MTPEFFEVNMDEILDLGGGLGEVLRAILDLGTVLKRHIIFDNPQVKSRFERLFKQAKEKGIC